MLAIIDGDILCYYACKARWKKKARIEEGISYIPLDSDGRRIPLDFTKEEDRYYLEETWDHFKKDLYNLLETVFCTDYVMAVKGETNFRTEIYPEYKIHRHFDPNKQNIFVPVLRKLAVAEDLATEAINCEADDLIRIWAEQSRQRSIPFIICSIDKDLLCIPGKHYNMKHKKISEVSEEEALRNFYHQLLKGDQTDNVPGVIGIGEVLAGRILESYHTEEEFQEQVVEQYMLAYGDEWKEQLLLNGRLIYLMKTDYDYFSFDNWPIIRELES